MPAQAKYEIYIPYPSVVSSAAMAYAKTEIPDAHVSVEHGRQVYTDAGQENFSVLHVTSSESPFTDSTVKQIASFVGEHLNLPTVMVSKAGKSGINIWNIRNTALDYGGSAPAQIPTKNFSAGT